LDLAGWSERRLAASVLALLTVVYLATATYDADQIIDTASTAAQSWTIAERGTPELGDVPGVPWVVDTPRGTVTNRLPGAVLWGLPFYALRATLFGPAPVETAFDIPLAPAGAAGAMATALGMVAMTVGLRRLVGPLGIAAGLTLALATPTWGVSANALWTHAVTQLGLGIVVLALASARVHAAGLGFLIGTVARPHVAVVAAAVGLHDLLRRRLATPVILGLWTAAGLGTVGLYAWVLSGRFSVTGLYGSRVTNAVAVTGVGDGGSTLLTWAGGLLLMLVSPERGVLFYAPIVAVLLPTLRWGWRASPWWVRSLAVGGMLQLALQAAGQPIWRGGDTFFGFRLQLEALTAATPLLAVSAREALQRGSPWRRTIPAAVAVSFLLNLLGATVLTKGAWPG
jgi:hypothetical protein